MRRQPERTFRDTHTFRDLAVADIHGFLLPLLLSSEPQIDEVTDWAPVMPDEIAHQAIENVFIQLNHAIPTVNIAMPHTLHNREGTAALIRPSTRWVA